MTLVDAHIGAAELAAHLHTPPPTPEQAAAIEAPLGPGVLVAGAGSGKTETMAARVVWLIANDLVDPAAVLGLTFTRKAAGELGHRIRRRLAQWRAFVEQTRPDDQRTLARLNGGEPTVLTYAAYAGRLVGEHGMRLGAEPEPRLLSEAVRWQWADRVVRAYTGRLPDDLRSVDSVTGWVLDLAGTLADHLVEPPAVERFCAELVARVEALPGKPNGDVRELLRHTRMRQELLPLVAAFSALKAQARAVDFGDQTAAAARLGGLPDVQRIERERYRVVLLDEYQDTGHAQVELLHGLFGDGHPVTAVGDPLQSIYGWRGASAGTIGRFAGTFRNAAGAPARLFPLPTSWRNDRAVLSVANVVSAPLRDGQTAVELEPRPDAGPGRVRVVRTATVEDEAQWVAERMREAWDAQPAGARTAAVLVRRRAQIPLLSAALTRAGLPVEVVGLGGLLTTSEVTDVVAVLRLLADHRGNSAAARLLTGARWRLSARDLSALGRRARALATGVDVPAGAGERSSPTSLIEAIDDPGPAERYSPEGHRRITALGEQLRRLRSRVGEPLPDLIAEVERVIGLDVEVAVRGHRDGIGRVHLDRFLDEAARFADDADESTLRAFLAYLDAAEDEEHGLEPGTVEVSAERVQVITVHGAKGLEWDVVAVPGLVEKVFPADPKSVAWTKARHLLPTGLRGDRDELPDLQWAAVSDCRTLAEALTGFVDEAKRRHALEERRLAYVAVTRARRELYLSGFVWDTTTSPRQPSPFLTEAADVAGVDEWYEPAPDEENPMTARTVSADWPLDPLGSRRAAVEGGAELVRQAALRAHVRARPATSDGMASNRAVPHEAASDAAVAERIAHWQRDLDALLAERARMLGADVIDVDLPDRLSVTQLVALRNDPAELARSLHRPLPARPAPLARRGTRFHEWLEQRWQSSSLLDIDELPGAADEGATDADLQVLQEAFRRSPWWVRTPAHVEVPFEMTIAGTVVRGRMDAVFEESGGGWTVVDWKTGSRPSGARARAADVQLAVYRLAWAALNGIPDDQLHRVGAAFHYVASNETVRPHDLLDAVGLRALITGLPG